MLDIYLTGEIGYEITAEKIIQAVNNYDGNEKKMNIVINSFGGDVFEGIAIYQLLNKLKKEGWKITTEGIGMVASASVLPFLAGEERILYEGTYFLVHQVSGGAYGNAEDLKKVSEEMEKLDEVLAKIYADRTYLSEEQAIEIMKEDTQLDIDTSLKLGFATKKQKLEAVASIIRKKNKAKLDNMKIIEKLKNQFTNQAGELEITLADGTIINVHTDGETPAVGDAVTDMDGNVLADGEYTTAEGYKLVVEGGKIIVYEKIETEPEVPEEVIEAIETLGKAIMNLTNRMEKIHNELKNVKTNIKSKSIEIDGKTNTGYGNAQNKWDEIIEKVKEKLQK